MVDVTEKNFRQWWPEMEKAIDSASFIALDLEFLGLPTSDGQNVSLFDTPAERYAYMSSAVRRFPPCQMGVACFREMDDGAEYEVEVWCVGLFKRLARKVFSFSLSAMSFLAKHNFDFNKFVSDGVTYSNRAELSRLKKDIVAGDIDYDTLSDRLDHRLQMLKVRLLIEARESDSASGSEECSSGMLGMRRARWRRDTSTSYIGTGQHLHLPRPLLIELVGNKEGGDGDVTIESLWDRPLTAVESAAVVHSLSEEHPNMEFQVDPTRTLLYCAERPLMFRQDKKRTKNVLRSFLAELSGASQIIHLINEKKVPLVMHNSLLDLLYLYHCFENDLPDSYEAWKKCVHLAFPTVIDTRLLATTVQEKLRQHGVSDFSLQTLGNYFDSPSCGQILPFKTPLITGGVHSQGIFHEGEHYHNAAFDALMTGEVFVKLVYLYAFTKSGGAADLSCGWPLRKLLFACRAQVANRVPIPLIDSSYCNLAGDDPSGCRPDMLVLEWMDSPLGQTRWGEWLRVARRWLRPSTPASASPVSQEEVERLKSELQRQFGDFRVDARIRKCCDGVCRVEVATNTANTFTRVCSYVSQHGRWKLIGGAATHEERLHVSRMDRKKRKGSGRKPETPTATDNQGVLITSSLLGAVCVVVFIAWKIRG